MKIEEGLYRLRAVWVSTDGETMVHYDRHLLEDYNDLRKWKDDTLKMIEGYGGVVSSCTVEPYKT